MYIDTNSAIAQAEAQIGKFPALFAKAQGKAASATIKSGRTHLVALLWKSMGLRWKTVAKHYAKYQLTGNGSGKIELHDAPISPNSFKGKWSGRNYSLQVLKSGFTVVIPNAFKGKGVDGKFALFSRDMNAASVRQQVGHYTKNIGKLRKPTHKVKPIMMHQVIEKKPSIITDETEFLNATFTKQMTKATAAALGVKRG